MPVPLSLKDAAFFVWEQFLNAPYLWGGDDPLAGVDCSGLVLEGLKSVGIVPREADYSAHDILHGLCKELPRVDPGGASDLKRGMLVFWNAGARVRHVEIVWAAFYGQASSPRVLTIGASGGGSSTVDRVAAIQQNAYTKIRRVSPGWVAAVDPFLLAV